MAGVTTSLPVWKPSTYLKDALLNLYEKVNAAATSQDLIVQPLPDGSGVPVNSDVSKDQAIFKPSHHVLLLQNYVIGETYDIPIKLRNIDKVPRKIKIEPSANPVFKYVGIKGDALPQAKVAANGETAFIVRFAPNTSFTGGETSIRCVTERESIIIPVKCSEPKAVIEIADLIDLEPIAVHQSCTRDLEVRNVGKVDGVVSFQVESPFSVIPSECSIAAHSTAIITIQYKPVRLGHSKVSLRAIVHGQAQLETQLDGVSQSRNVSLLTTEVHLDTVYVTRYSEKTLTVVNDSDQSVQFFFSREADARLRKSSVAPSESRRQDELPSYLPLPDSLYASSGVLDAPEACGDGENVQPADFDPPIPELYYIRRAEEWRDSSFVVPDPCGNVEPHSTISKRILFNPMTSGSHHETLYLHAYGLEQPLQVQIYGDAIGPEAAFEMEDVDLGEMYVGQRYERTFQLTNIGDVMAQYNLQSHEFAAEMHFEPSCGTVSTGCATQISALLQPHEARRWERTLQWRLDGSSSPVTLHLNADVRLPEIALKLNEEPVDLNLGQLAHSFERSVQIDMHNLSPVDITYEWSVVTSDTRQTERIKNIRVSPASNKLLQGQAVQTSISILPMHIGHYECRLDLRIPNGAVLCSVPLTAEVSSPVVDVILMDRPTIAPKMFLGHEYTYSVRLRNASDTDARYHLSPQDTATQALYRYQSHPANEIVVPAQGQTDVSISVEVYQTGPVAFEMLYTSSSGESSVPVAITAFGVGPSVRVVPANLEWNTIPVLQPVFRTLALKNESLIPAEFSCTLNTSKSAKRPVFQVDPSKGVVAAGEERLITVNCFLNDAGAFHDQLKVDFMDAGAFHVSLSASGEGSCITIDDDENMNPLDLGSLVRDQRYERAFYMVNRGQRTEVLTWETEMVEVPINAKSAARGCILISPNRLMLKSGQRYLMHIHGVPEVVGRYEQIFHCFGTPEHSNEKRKLLALTVRAECVRPLLTKTLTGGTTIVSSATAGQQRSEIIVGNSNPVTQLGKTTELRVTAVPATGSIPPLDGVKAPSDAIKEFSMSFEDRLLRQLRHQPPLVLTSAPHRSDVDLSKCRVPDTQPIFKPNYTAITLEQYEVGKTYEISFTLRNIDKVARRIRVDELQEPELSLKQKGGSFLSSGKVAPGMELSYTLRFLPMRYKDSVYYIRVTTERETFSIPVSILPAEGILTLPDSMSFLDSPVALKTTKSLLVKNIGPGIVDFRAVPSKSFTVNPSSGSLAPGADLQLTFEFFPQKIGRYTEWVRFHYGAEKRMDIALEGTAENLPMFLENSSLNFPQTYMTLAFSRLLKVFNKSNYTAKYHWSYADQGSAVFRIEPDHGTLWPNTVSELTALFEPMEANHHSAQAYLHVQGLEKPLCLSLEGSAMGPKAQLSYDLLEIGQIYVKTKHIYQIKLTNTGAIPCSFRIRPSRTGNSDEVGQQAANDVTFTPPEGIVDVGGVITILMTFEADLIGEFDKEYQCHLAGSTVPLTFSLRGEVIGPHFTVSETEVDIGIISYSLSLERSFKIKNDASIPLNFWLEWDDEACMIKEDSRGLHVMPTNGCIAPGDEEIITMTLHANELGPLERYLTIGIMHVGPAIQRVRVKALCIIPAVSLQEYALQLGEIHLHHETRALLTVINKSDQPARFSVIPGHASDEMAFFCDASPNQAIVEARASFQVELLVNISQKGHTAFPVFVSLAGAEHTPIVANVFATGVGPTLLTGVTDLDFGTVDVLTHHRLVLPLRNTGVTKAYFNIHVEGDTSVFMIFPKEGAIAPGNEMLIDVATYLDDAARFADTLIVQISAGATLRLPLCVRGQGSTIVFDHLTTPSNEIQFDNVFSSAISRRSMVMTNKGRKPQTVHWMLDEKRMATKLSDLGRATFSFVPNRFYLKSGQSQQVLVEASSENAGTLQEHHICYGIFDKDVNKRVLCETKLTAHFVQPVLSFEPLALNFFVEQTHESSSYNVLRNIRMTNTTSLGLDVILKCPKPFRLTKAEDQGFFLAPDEDREVTIIYDAKVHEDMISSQQQNRLQITYLQHPQKDHVDLIGESVFPNLHFHQQEVVFSSSVPHQTLRRTIKMKNTSLVPVKYNWAMHYHTSNLDAQAEALDQDTNRKSPFQPENKSMRDLCGARSLPFDIRPISGFLAPGQEEETDINFCTSRSGNFVASALCEVVGGPSYEVLLKAETTDASYIIEKDSYFLGDIPYHGIVDFTVTIQNTSATTLDYESELDPLSSSYQRLYVQPSHTRIAPGAKLKVNVRFCPCAFGDVESHFHVRLGSARLQKITVRARGTASLVLVDLPLIKGSSTPGNIEAAMSSFGARSLAHLKDSVRPAMYAALQKARAVGSPLLAPSASLAASNSRGANQRQHTTMSELQNVPLMVYTCYLGVVVRTTIRKKTLRIFNDSNATVLLNISTGGHGSNVEDAKSAYFSSTVEKMKLPAKEWQEIGIVFNANAKAEFNSGIVTQNFWFTSSGGASILVTAKANLSVPQLRVNKSMLAFGELLIGQRRTVHATLINTGAVPCDWTIDVTDVQGTGARERRMPSLARVFQVTPDHGLLSANERKVIAVTFTPDVPNAFDMAIPIKVGMNSQSIPLKFVANAIKPSLEISHRSITFPSTIPNAETVTATLSITNTGDRTLELIAAFFDPVILQSQKRFQSSIGSSTAASEPIWTTIPQNASGSTKSGSAEKLPLQVCMLLHYPLHGGIEDLLPSLTSLSHVKTIDAATLWARALDVARSRPQNGSASTTPHDPSGMNDTRKLAEKYLTKYIKDHILAATKQHHLVFMHEAAPDVAQTADPLSVLLLAQCISDGLSCCVESWSFYYAPLVNNALQVRDREISHNLVRLTREIDALTQQLDSPENGIDGDKDAESHSDVDLLIRTRRRKQREYDDFVNALKQFQLEERQRREHRMAEENAQSKKKTLRMAGNQTSSGTTSTSQSAPNGASSTSGMGPAGVSSTAARPYSSRLISSGPQEVGPNNEEIFFLAESTDLSLKQFGRDQAHMISLIRECNGRQHAVKENAVHLLPGAVTGAAGGVADGGGLMSNANAAGQSTLLTGAAQNSTSSGSAGTGTIPITSGQKNRKVNEALIDFLDMKCPPVLRELDSSALDATRRSITLQDIFVALDHHLKSDEEAPADILEEILHYHPEFTPISDAACRIYLASDGTDVSVMPTVAGSTPPATISAPTTVEKSKRGQSGLVGPSAAAGSSNNAVIGHANGNMEEIASTVTRWQLVKGTTTDIRLRCATQSAGIYQRMLFFSVAGSSSLVPIPCQVESIFPAVIPSVQHRGKSIRPVITRGSSTGQQYLFDLGPIVANRPKEKGLDKSQEHRAFLSLTNESLDHDLTLTFSTLNDQKHEYMTFEATSVMVPAAANILLPLLIHPKTPGTYQKKVSVSIKDNPNPLEFTFQTQAIKPEVELLTSSVTTPSAGMNESPRKSGAAWAFDKTVLGHAVYKEVRWKNHAPLAIAWRISGLETLGDDIRLSATEGILEAFEEGGVRATLLASKVMQIKKQVKLEFADLEKSGSFAQVENINISGEVFEAQIECNGLLPISDIPASPSVASPSVPVGVPSVGPRQATSHLIDFGSHCRLYEEVKQTFVLKNKGKYDMQVQSDVVDGPYNKWLTLQIQSGVITAGDSKGITCTVNLRPGLEMELKSSPVFKLYLTDIHTGIKVESILLHVSARAASHKLRYALHDELTSGSSSSMIPVPSAPQVLTVKSHALLHGSDASEHKHVTCAFPTCLPGQKSVCDMVVENTGDFDLKFVLANGSTARATSTMTKEKENILRASSKEIARDGASLDVHGAENSLHSGNIADAVASVPATALASGTIPPFTTTTPSSTIAGRHVGGLKASNMHNNGHSSGGTNAGASAVTSGSGNRTSVLTLGRFSVQPSSGCIPAGDKLTFRIEYSADKEGCHEETVRFDVADRSESAAAFAATLNDVPNDISMLQIRAECCEPTFDMSPAIFFQHCHGKEEMPSPSMTSEGTTALRSMMQHSGASYSRPKNVLQFAPVLLGQTQSTQLYLHNPRKVPCDVTVTQRHRTKMAQVQFDKVHGLGASTPVAAHSTATINTLGANPATVSSSLGGSHGTTTAPPVSAAVGAEKGPERVTEKGIEKGNDKSGEKAEKTTGRSGTAVGARGTSAASTAATGTHAHTPNSSSTAASMPHPNASPATAAGGSSATAASGTSVSMSTSQIPSASAMHHGSVKESTEDIVFATDVTKLSIPPFDSVLVTLSFAPTSQGHYAAIYEFATNTAISSSTLAIPPPSSSSSSPLVAAPTASAAAGGGLQIGAVSNSAEKVTDKQKLHFEVQGIGAVPRANFVTMGTAKEKPALKFRKTVLDHQSKRYVQVANTGLVACQISLQVGSSSVSGVAGDSMGGSSPMLKNDAGSDPDVFTLVGETRKVWLQFAPRHARRYDTTLVLRVEKGSLAVPNSPSGGEEMTLTGEGVQSSILFEDLSTSAGIAAMPVLPTASTIAATPVDDDVLAFENVRLGDTQRQLLRVCHNQPHLSNHLHLEFRAEETMADIVCQPSTLILKPHEKRTIDVIFSPKRAYDRQMGTLHCHVTVLSERDQPLKQEEPISKQSESKDGVEIWPIAMRLSADVVPHLEASITQLVFEDILMYRKRTARFTLRNPGLIDTPFSLPIISQQGNTALSPATILPSLAGGLTGSSGSHLNHHNNSTNTNKTAFHKSGVGAALSSTMDTFTVTPNTGIIKRGESISVQVCFFPSGHGRTSAVLQCLSCPLSAISLSTQSEEVSQHQITLSGASMIPYCHLELPDSYYLATLQGRSDALTSREIATLPVDTPTLHFQSHGLGERVEKSFAMINPTSVAYDYHWRCLQPQDNKKSPVIKCKMVRGTLSAGARTTAHFSFAADSIGTVESLWSLEIPSKQVNIQVLMVAECLNPGVAFANAEYTVASPIAIGKSAKCTLKLVNYDHVPHAYHFPDLPETEKRLAVVPMSVSLDQGEHQRASEAQLPTLSILPKRGVVAPMSVTKVVATFTPSDVGSYRTLIKCLVKRRDGALSFAFNGEGRKDTQTHESTQ